MTICRHGVDSSKAGCANCKNTKRRKNSLRIRKFIAPVINLLILCFGLPSWGGCQSCGIQQHIVPFHDLEIGEDYKHGPTLICEACWRDISEVEKLKIYRQFFEKYPPVTYSWGEIQKAIAYPFYWNWRDSCK